MNLDQTAFIFIGYQNDYFAADGILRAAIEESAVTNRVLENTLQLIDNVSNSGTTMIQTPIIFTPSYEELVNPVGILKVIQDVGAFQEGKTGSEVIPPFKAMSDRIQTISGKRGLNAFSNTELASTLEQNNITTVVMAGAVTSICIDSTARSAHERGYSVVVLDDCTAGRSNFEQTFYCENIFPLYASVMDSSSLLDRVT
jgi:nicotinamidase-related amidase